MFLKYVRQRISDEQLRKACDEAVSEVAGRANLTARSVSVGFYQSKYSRQGIQVFVEACIFDQDLLDNQPESGGLLKYKKPVKPKRSHKKKVKSTVWQAKDSLNETLATLHGMLSESARIDIEPKVGCMKPDIVIMDEATDPVTKIKKRK